MKNSSREMDNLRPVRISNRKLNVVRGNISETKEHFMKKCELFYSLRQKGHNVITEAIFESGLRADVLDLTDGIIYEVAVSEKEESLIRKKNTYPANYYIEVVRV